MCAVLITASRGCARVQEVGNTEIIQPKQYASPELNAYCRGFLLVKDKSLDNAIAFCKGFLFALDKSRTACEKAVPN